jgi:peptidyl-prolyl cis-trans isomerase A (cyclophilin A)
MLRRLICLLLVALCLTGTAYAAGKNPIAVIETNMGNIRVELFKDEAPITVKNFEEYAKSGFYNGTVFHRVIPRFMIQGGGMTADLTPKQTREPIKNEATNGLMNDRGTIAMARTGVVDSATSQFFINVVDNYMLNHRPGGPQNFGYAVFGKVISGMDVVDKIVATPTGYQNGMSDVPVTPVVIKSVKIQK